MKKYTQVLIRSFKGENYSCGKKVTCNVIAVANNSELFVEDFTLNDAYVYSREGFMIHLYEYLDDEKIPDNKYKNPKCVIYGMELTNIIQISESVSSLFWMEYGYLSIQK
ncbi:hypothetical protein PIROE2DRAFT_9581 [Piromyces sp. E2]|nr:hypothetical protein PIROE2DRAFT_9581 [Piromyces sp. E2]|eukprot:OUM63839.1 hypothetical protein PIROE2DRAFT_9581 [Piromyces sp. E2]